MTTLRISPTLELPLDVAGEAIAILAKRGAGKTNTATVLVEELYAAGVQIVILDPVGAWWGIRSSADGTSGGLAVARLGGEHGDVPLEPTAGALIADVVVDTGKSVLLDLSDFASKAAMARFVVDFGERLFRRKARERSLVHLVLEEADTFAPQKGSSDDARMRGAIEQIVRRGRSRGLGMTMVTQRSAVLNKDVLSQADVLIAMRTTSPHDVAAIRSWISVHADDEHGVIDSLPGLDTGEAWVWNPERGLLDRVRVRPRLTFDSSSTPKAGERRAEPKQTADIDLTQLGEQIQATAERARENDPAELRRRVRELETQIAAPAAEPVVERVEVPVFNGEVDRLEEAVRALVHVGEQLHSVGAALEGAVGSIASAVATARSVPAVSPRLSTTPQRKPSTARTEPSGRGSRSAPAAAPDQGASGGGSLTGPEQRVIDAIAWYSALGIDQPTKLMVGFIAGYRVGKRIGGTYGNILGTLRGQGLVDYPAAGTVTLTDTGAEVARDPGIGHSNEALQEAVLEKLDGPESRVLSNLIAAYPRAMSKQELGGASGYTVGDRIGGTFGNILGRLRSLGLIDYPAPGEAVALPVLFPEGT